MVNNLLTQLGLLLKAATAVDTPLIAAPTSTKNKDQNKNKNKNKNNDKERDPEMHSSK